MPLFIVAVGIVLLIILVSFFRLNAFLALLITSFTVGLFNGMNFGSIIDSILSGVGDTLGKIVIILVLGVMLGKLLEESGATYTITYKLTERFGSKYIRYALLLTGLVVGLPLIFNVGFFILIPLVFTISSTLKQPLVWLALPLICALSFLHCVLPPHPAPTYISFVYEAEINSVLLYGFIPLVPTVIFGGLILSHFFRKIDINPPAELFSEQHFEKNQLPGLGISIFCAVIPVVLMMFGAILDLFIGAAPPKPILTQNGYESLTAYYQHLLLNKGLPLMTSAIISNLLNFIKSLSDPNIALFMAVIFGVIFLGIRRGKSMDSIMNSIGKSVASISMIILIVGGGGAFSQVLKDSNTTDYITSFAAQIPVNPLLIAFIISAFFRLTTGSATVSALATAPIMLPLAQQSGTSPELIVLATGAGSVMWPHFNDTGFWLFKEYFNLSIKQTFLTWSVMETIIGLSTIAIVLIMDMFI